MAVKIKTIATSIVNCYLMETDAGFILVDTGMCFQRGAFKKALREAGCRPGNLKLIVITHGDWDHTGSAAYLQKKYGAKVIAHKKEAVLVERGDMFSSRKTKWGIVSRIMLAILRPLMFRACKPDIYIEGEKDLAEYGIDARIIHVPGHSVGSVGVLTKEGDFFCGDLLTNSGKPQKNKLVDDAAAMDASIEKMKTLNIKTVYPGHGKPFKMEELEKGI